MGSVDFLFALITRFETRLGSREVSRVPVRDVITRLDREQARQLVAGQLDDTPPLDEAERAAMIEGLVAGGLAVRLETHDGLPPDDPTGGDTPEPPVANDPRRVLYCLRMHLQPLAITTALAARFAWVAKLDPDPGMAKALTGLAVKVRSGEALRVLRPGSRLRGRRNHPDARPGPLEAVLRAAAARRGGAAAARPHSRSRADRSPRRAVAVAHATLTTMNSL